MNVDLRSIAGNLASVAWVAVRSFLGTFILFTLVGVVMAGLSCYFLYDRHWIYGVITAVVVALEAAVLGLFFGAKRAGVMALAHGLGKLRLGGALVRLVFERMLGIAEGQEFGKLAGQISRGLERVPLAQAAELLKCAVHSVTCEPEQGGWVRRKIRARLLDAVHKYTLARFREEGAKHGSIDLLKVKRELEQSVDDVIVAKVRSGLRLWTWLAIIGLPLAAALQTWLAVLLVQWIG
jgi:hypothetical protein